MKKSAGDAEGIRPPRETPWVGSRGGWVIPAELEPLGLKRRSGDQGLDEMRSEKPTAYFCLGRDLHERRHNFACSTGMEWAECPTGYPSQYWPIRSQGSPGDTVLARGLFYSCAWCRCWHKADGTLMRPFLQMFGTRSEFPRFTQSPGWKSLIRHCDEREKS